MSQISLHLYFKIKYNILEIVNKIFIEIKNFIIN